MICIEHATLTVLYPRVNVDDNHQYECIILCIDTGNIGELDKLLIEKSISLDHCNEMPIGNM
jgi:hypothetical protein